MTRSPFHAGERRAQEIMGVREAVEPIGQRVIRPFMPEQHRTFFSALPYLVVAAEDGRVAETALTEAVAGVIRVIIKSDDPVVELLDTVGCDVYLT